jgi:hypothetical protein
VIDSRLSAPDFKLDRVADAKSAAKEPKMRSPKTNDGLSSQAKWAVLFALYLGGIVALLVDAPLSIQKLIRILGSYLWGPIAFVLVSPLLGFLYLFVPIAGTMAFAMWPMRFSRTRLAASCAVLATLYLLGNYLGFHRDQWYLLHCYMCGGLIVVGTMVPAAKYSAWVAFIVLVIAYVLHFRVEAWRFLDYAWGLYFLGLSIVACAFPTAVVETHST